VAIEFDGVYMDSDVWLNGTHWATILMGTPFAYDLTDFLIRPEFENVLAVRVRNVGRDSRWYSGSGIYGTSAPHHDPSAFRNGVCVTTPRSQGPGLGQRRDDGRERSQRRGVAHVAGNIARPHGRTLRTWKPT